MFSLVNLIAILLIIFSAVPARAVTDCLPIEQASHHIGETKCVTGKVHRVSVGSKGVHFLDFCEDQMACPFTVVVFPHSLKDVGDVRRLEGRNIEIHGAVKSYDGRAEIVLNRVSQFTGGSTSIPPCPRTTMWKSKATTVPAACVPY